eukprot:1650997-Rhodomonas_salina.3
MKHLPKVYTFGTVNGYVSVTVNANGVPMGEAPTANGAANAVSSGCFKTRVAPLEAQNSGQLRYPPTRVLRHVWY